MAKNYFTSVISDITSLMRGNFLLLTLSRPWIVAWLGTFTPYLSIYFTALGGTYLQLGALLAICTLSGAIASIPAGYYCDYYGRRKIVIVGGHLTSLAAFIRALSVDWPGFFIGHVLWYVSIFWVTAEQVVLMDSLPADKRGLGFAVHSTMVGVAGLVSPFVGAWIYTQYGITGMKILLFAIAFAQLVKGVVMHLLLKETLHDQHRMGNVQLKMVAKQIAQSFTSLTETLRWMPTPLLGFCITLLLMSLGASFTGTQLVQLLRGQQLLGSFFVLYATVDVLSLSTIQWGVINTIIGGISVALTIFGGKLTDQYGRRRPIILFLGATSILSLAFTFSQTFPQVMVVLFASGIVGTLATPAWMTMELDYAPPEMRGKVYSLFRLLSAILAFLGSLLGGYLYSLEFTLPFWMYSLFAFLSLLAFITIKTSRNKLSR